MESSVRSLLAKWLGGSGTSPLGGIRSLLARWLGGAATEAIPQDGLLGGGSADVARIRSYEASGGGVFDGSASVVQVSGQQDFSVVVTFPAPVQPVPKPAKKPKKKRRVRQIYSYEPEGGLELSASAIVSRSRAIVAIGGFALRAESAVLQARSISSNSKRQFIISGSADVETYDAIYDTEDEEILLLMMAAAA